MTPLVVENEPPVTFLRRKMTGGRFSMGVVIRRYTGRTGVGREERDLSVGASRKQRGYSGGLSGIDTLFNQSG